MYDYLVVGAGLFGSVFVHESKKRGYGVLVIDKRSHIGGNVYSEKIEKINKHFIQIIKKYESICNNLLNLIVLHSRSRYL